MGESLIIATTAKQIDAQVPSNEQFFELLPGKNVDLQFKTPMLVRLKAILVGYEVGKYILLKHPDPKGDNSHKDVLKEGNVGVIRYIVEGDKGECCAFRSTITHISQYPERFIYLSYPEHVENRQLRLNQRVSVHIPAEITMQNDDKDKPGMRISGIVIDISERGCGFIFRSQNLKVSVKKRDIFVIIRNSGGDPVRIPARVCNSGNDRGKVHVGIAFVDADKQIKELLKQLFINSDVA